MSVKTNLLKSVGNYFHVYNRGAHRNPIFFEERNYDYFLQRMEKYKNNDRIQIVSYCLMPNHFHFLLYQITENAISEYVRGVCDGYVKAVNKAYHRSGHLFEGKYKLKLVDDEQYLLHLSRYIHINPVDAHLAAHPGDWKYSSYYEYLGKTDRTIVIPSIILQQFNNIDGYIDFTENYKRDDDEQLKNFLFVEE